MDNPRPEKVAVVKEVRERLEEADAALLTEYRGISVAGMQSLRRSLRDAGGDYKIYKNTLVRLAMHELGFDLDDLLTGPTAIAFVAPGPDGQAGDPVLVAKALKEFAKTNPNLVVKGGLLGDRILGSDEAGRLADVASREELLARIAGGLAAPMQQFAALLNAVPAKFAYALQALIDAGGAPGAPEMAPEAAPVEEPVSEPSSEPVAEAETASESPITDPAAAQEAPVEPTAEATETDQNEASDDAESTTEEN